MSGKATSTPKNNTPKQGSAKKAQLKAISAKAFHLPKPEKQFKGNTGSIQAFEKGARRREQPGERMVLYLPPDNVTRLRVIAAEERRSLSHVVTEAVGQWLASRES